MSAFENLSRLLQEQNLYATSASVLGWDQETNLPKSGIPHRADQLALLSGKVHELGTSAQFQKALEEAETEAQEGQEANLREIRHHFERATCLPQSLVEKDSQAGSLAKSAWMKARKEDDFASFAPHLETLLAIAREKCELWSYPDEPYTALLSEYERGAQTSQITSLFEKLKPEVAKIAAEAVVRSEEISADALKGHAPIASQKELNHEIAASIGYDFDSGRIDTTAHPFCTTLGPQDVRLTNRYDENDFSSSLFGILHEAGHGLYQQGLPSQETHLPSGSPVSLGIHESQSRLWENHVGRSQPFWEKWLPRAQELFPHLKKLSLEQFLAAINRAQYSFVRVEADEATYDLHILLRFTLERLLINGELAVKDVPEAWNSEFKNLFGMTPPNNTVGCLQDIHWAMGGLGYFATYTLGNLNSAQIFESALREESVKSAFEQGNFAPLLGSLRREIHAKGSTLLPQDLMQSATGRETNATAYLAHLKERFL
jgi:carboxypeptidase Taq